MTRHEMLIEGRYRSCGSKIRYHSRAVAEANRRRRESEMSLFGDDSPLSTYECPCCHGWHLGNAKSSRDRANYARRRQGDGPREVVLFGQAINLKLAYAR